jgi:hypothetical protein
MKLRSMCILLLAPIFACGRTEQRNFSDVKYRLASPLNAGLTRQVKNETIRVCYSDASNSAAHRNDVEFAILEWIRPLRSQSDTPLTNAVKLVSRGQPCDVAVSVGNYSPAYTDMGNLPSVHINSSGWYGSKTVTLHEMGHAFGLLDTYNGRGGSCQTGQPESVMCRASFTALKADDELGIIKMLHLVEGMPPAELQGDGSTVRVF